MDSVVLACLFFVSLSLSSLPLQHQPIHPLYLQLSDIFRFTFSPSLGLNVCPSLPASVSAAQPGSAGRLQAGPRRPGHGMYVYYC